MHTEISPQQNRVVLLALIVAMTLTRFHEIGNWLHLYDASMAVFFLGGLLLSRQRYLPVFMLLALVIDFAAITLRGEKFLESHCVTPSYGFLFVSYAVLWYGGRLAQRWLHLRGQSLAAVTLAAMAASTLAFAISNGSFYWLGGRYANPHFAEYIARAWQWGPSYVLTATAYVVAGLLIWVGVAAHARRRAAAAA